MMESISVRPCSFILVRGGLGWIDLDLILDKLVMGLFHPNPTQFRNNQTTPKQSPVDGK
jgi:hypothetical protein